jgi:hypothetical protein
MQEQVSEREQYLTDASNRDREARIAQLADQGIFPGSVAYERDIASFDRQLSDIRSRCRGLTDV